MPEAQIAEVPLKALPLEFANDKGQGTHGSGLFANAKVALSKVDGTHALFT